MLRYPYFKANELLAVSRMFREQLSIEMACSGISERSIVFAGTSVLRNLEASTQHAASSERQGITRQGVCAALAMHGMIYADFGWSSRYLAPC